MKRSVWSSLLLLPTVALGCASTESQDVRTSGIFATFTATSDGTTTKAQAIFRVGEASSNTFVNLESGDSATVTVGQDARTLTENHLGDYYFYSVDVPVVAGASEFVFALTREADEDAPNSRVALPEPLTVSAPAASANLSRAQALTITWAPASLTDAITIEVKGDCIVDYRRNVSGDPGTFQIEGAAIQAHNNRTGESCPGTVVVTRSRNGTLDPAYSGGLVTGAQQRTVSVRLDP